jgi:putative NADH-flavin reductase
LLLKRAYKDKERQEKLIKESDLAWIIVRPGFLTNRPETGKYRAITDMEGVKAGWISRSDVARFMLEQAESPTFLHKTPLLIS